MIQQLTDIHKVPAMCRGLLLTQVLNVPTRNEALLDLLLTNQ